MTHSNLPSFAASSDGPGRSGLLHTMHGSVDTPAFVPLATNGAVGSLRAEDLEAAGVQMLAVSLFGLALRPGPRSGGAVGRSATIPELAGPDPG